MVRKHGQWRTVAHATQLRIIAAAVSEVAPSTTVGLSKAEDAAAVEVRKPPRVALRSGVDLSRFYATWAMGAGFPAVTGLLLYGWRALAMLIVILPTALLAMAAWRRIGARGRQLHTAHTLWLTVLLWLMLPAHLLNGPFTWLFDEVWPIPIAAGLLLVILMWLLGGVGSGRIHPVVVTFLLLMVAFEPMMAPTAVLQRHRSLTGDLANALPPPQPSHAYMKEGYLKTERVAGADALLLEPAAKRLHDFTSGQKRPGRSWLSLESLLRDEMPPLEDLIIGGQPGPIGATCAVAVIIGGLFLLYRGIIDFRVPLAILVGAFVALLALPIPLFIKEDGPDWRWFIWRTHQVLTQQGPRYESVGWAKAVTFANYEIMAGPMLLMTFFLATAPAVRPMARRARVIYGLLVGVLAAGLQLYVSIAYGPYLALLIVSLLTPWFDRMFRQHPLV
jgi:Na+-translocating ferredoxin:NAD+ oxidoreductase RnfD subunit